MTVRHEVSFKRATVTLVWFAVLYRGNLGWVSWGKMGREYVTDPYKVTLEGVSQFRKVQWCLRVQSANYVPTQGQSRGGFLPPFPWASSSMGLEPLGVDKAPAVLWWVTASVQLMAKGPGPGRLKAAMSHSPGST